MRQDDLRAQARGRQRTPHAPHQAHYRTAAQPRGAGCRKYACTMRALPRARATRIIAKFIQFKGNITQHLMLSEASLMQWAQLPVAHNLQVAQPSSEDTPWLRDRPGPR